jgi:hypothetical protein
MNRPRSAHACSMECVGGSEQARGNCGHYNAYIVGNSHHYEVKRSPASNYPQFREGAEAGWVATKAMCIATDLRS